MNPSCHSSAVMFSSKLLALVLIVLLLPATAAAQLVNGRLISSVYTWEAFDTVGVSKHLVRGYQSVLLDITQSNFSLYTHLQGAISLKSKLDETPDFRAWYLFGRWRDICSVADLSFGRLPYYAGVGVGTLDGALATFRFADDAVRMTVYGGAPVPFDLSLNDWKPLKNNYVAGGQFVSTAITGLRLGLSYVNQRRSHTSYWGVRSDSLFNPVPEYITPEADREQLSSLDASYRTGILRLYGRTDYNIVDNKTQRAQGGLRIELTEDLTFSGEYLYRTPRIPFNSIFAFFPTSTITEVEGGFDYRFTPSIAAFARGGWVKYEGDHSFRYTVGVSQTYVYLSYRGNSGYAGELNSVSLQGAYPLLDRLVIPNVGVSASSYKLNAAADRVDALAGSVGTTVRPWQLLAVDLQVQWLRNKVYKDDVRFFAKLNYWFSERFQLFN